MKKIYTTLLITILVLMPTYVLAESTVYVFMKSVANMETIISLNGKEVFEMVGPIKKTISPGGNMRLPFHQLSACKRKCILKEEGKVLFSLNSTYTNAVNEKVSKYAAEIQLNLFDGSVHYIMITNKGMNDVQIVELNEKKATKLLDDKKYVFLPEYIGK